jgi:hypothetical protein
MKIVKLTRRFKMYSDGYTHALRWDHWNYSDVEPYEKALKKLYGKMTYNYRISPWVGNFGSKIGSNGHKPYFIYVRNELMITASLLMV